MFCIKSDVITLGSIEMYGLVTVWTSMDDGPYWVILLMNGSHDMRHTGFRGLTVVYGTPGFWGVIGMNLYDCFTPEFNHMLLFGPFWHAITRSLRSREDDS